MGTFIDHLLGRVKPELTEENKTKVCLIADINKAWKNYSQGNNIDSRQFDDLYDSDVPELERTLKAIQDRIVARDILQGRTQPNVGPL